MIYVYIDFEFNQTSERKLNVLCAAWQIWKKNTFRSRHSIWFDSDKDRKFFRAQMRKLAKQGAVFVGYQVTAEAGSFFSLGIHPFRDIKWLDLFLEYRMLRNHYHKFAYGRQLINGKERFTYPPKPKWQRTKADEGKSAPAGEGLGACCYKMLDIKIDTEHKDKMRDLIIAGGDFTEKDKADILKYCESDIKYLPQIRVEIEGEIKRKLRGRDRALYFEDALRRGDYGARTAFMERVGHPIDYRAAKNFSSHVGSILFDIAKEITEAFPDIKPFIFNPKKGAFQKKEKRIRSWIRENHTDDTGRLHWQETNTGQASLSLDAFKDRYPYKEDYPADSFGAQFVRFLRTQKAMNGFFPTGKAKQSFFDYVGKDHRVRPYFNIYGAQSARTQPKATGFIPLKASWMRVLIQPPPGWCYVAVDYSSQEFLLGALLSRDRKMAQAYHSGDPYMHTAILAGAAPSGATKKSHKLVRDKFKATVLGISYLMGKFGLARKLTDDTGVTHSPEDAEKLIMLFNETYAIYDEWRNQEYENYKAKGYLRLPCGWVMFGDNPNRRSVSNCPVQGMGSSIMREAVRRAQDNGFHVAFTLHDELCLLGPSKDVVGLADGLAEAMDGAFRHYFPKHTEADKTCRLSAKIWGPDFNDGDTIDTKWFGAQSVYTMCVNEKSSPDYAKYKSYFTYEDEGIALKSLLESLVG